MSDRRVYLILGIAFIFLAVMACSLPGAAVPAGSQPGSVGTTQPGVPVIIGGGGACDNQLYPVVAGASWSYSMTSPVVGNFIRSIVTVVADGFTDQDVFDSGITRTGQWKCDAGSLIALDPGGGAGATANVQTNNVNANFHTTAMDGVTFPAAINPGVSWSQNFTIEGIQNINGRDIPSKNETAYNCTAGGTESVTVPAGTFNAVRIDCQTNVKITITMNGADIPTDVAFTSTAWHAPGVGMVKTDSILQDGSTNKIELTSYNIP